MKLPRVPERTVQAQIVSLLRSLGAAVYVLGTKRRRGDYQGTQQTSGCPDILAFCRGRDGWTFVAIEVKSQGGRLRPEQRDFRECCERAHVAHIVGGLDEVIAWLITQGAVSPSSLPHTARKRRRRAHGPVRLR